MGGQSVQQLEKIEASPVPVKTEKYLTYEKNKLHGSSQQQSSERFRRIRQSFDGQIQINSKPLKRDFEADRVTRETCVDEVGQKAAMTAASNRNTQVHATNSSSIVESTHENQKKVRINVPNQIPK